MISRHILSCCAVGAALLLGACGGGGGEASFVQPASLSFSPTSVVAHVPQGASGTVEVVITAATEGDGALYIAIDDPDQVLSSTPSVTQLNQGIVVDLVTSPDLSPGHYSGTFNVRLCRDQACSSVYGGSQISLPYDITVDSVDLKALIPFEDETGLLLFDPRQPLSSSNPVLADATGWEASNGYTLLAADWDGTTLTAPWTAAQVYKKEGKLYRVNLAPAVSHAPVQISNIDTVCLFNRVFQDYQNPDNSWLLVSIRDSSGVCQNYRMIKAGASPTDPGITPTFFVSPSQIHAIQKADGSIAGFLTFEQGAIVRRDANLSHGTEVLRAFDSGTFGYHGFSRPINDSAGHLYFVSRAAGDPAPSLFRYDVGSGALTPIATYGSPNVPADSIGTLDAHDFYWGSGGSTGAIYRVSHSSTIPVRMSSASVAEELRFPSVTDEHVVFQRFHAESDSSGIYALRKDAEDAEPILIVDPGKGYTGVYRAHPNGTLLILNSVAGSPGTRSTYTSYIARDDGTVSATFNDRRWNMRVLDGVWGAGYGVARCVLEGVYDGGIGRQVYDTATGALLADLPAIENNIEFTKGSIGFGRYISFKVRMRYFSQLYWDAYVVDTITGVQIPLGGGPDHSVVAVLSDWNL